MVILSLFNVRNLFSVFQIFLFRSNDRTRRYLSRNGDLTVKFYEK